MPEGPPGPGPKEIRHETKIVTDEFEISPEIREWAERVIHELDENWEDHLTLAAESGQETPSIVNLLEAVGDGRLFSVLSEMEKIALANGLKQCKLISSGQIEMAVEENDIVFKPKTEQETEKTAEKTETITFKTECLYCGGEITLTIEVEIPKNPKIKKPKKGKPYYDIDCPAQVPCPKGCKHPDAEKPTLYTLWERRYVE